MISLSKAFRTGILFGMILLSSCGNSPAKTGYNLSLEDLKSRLKDPDSLKLGKCYYVNDEKSEKSGETTSYYYRINANAKNSYGAYAGAEDFYYTWLEGASRVTYGGTGNSDSNYYYWIIAAATDFTTPEIS
jgi:ABC-type oligopeptide transport system substrate-binding subunit